jgi:hypothetical protein
VLDVRKEKKGMMTMMTSIKVTKGKVKAPPSKKVKAPKASKAKIAHPLSHSVGAIYFSNKTIHFEQTTF